MRTERPRPGCVDGSSGGARAVFFGYGDFGVAAVGTLVEVGADIAAVVLPSNRSGPAVESVRAAAAARGLTVRVQPPRSRIAVFVDELRALAPDVLVVWSYTMILPREILEVPRHGAVNVHGGLLPEYRGGHVLQWAIINGETETGVTLHYMDEGIDTGPVIAKARFPIAWEDDARTVHERLRSHGRRLLAEWWPAIAAGTAPAVPQDERRARYYPMRRPEDGLIDWSAPAQRIYDLVRALAAPWPGAFTYLRARKVVARRARPIPDVARGVPGLVLDIDHTGLRVATGAGVLEVREVEVDGMPVSPRRLVELGAAPGTVFEAGEGTATR